MPEAVGLSPTPESLAQSYLQSGQDDFGYRRKVRVPKELGLLAEG